ncbi:MAG: dihydroorotase [Planctomycetota bacterium]
MPATLSAPATLFADVALPTSGPGARGDVLVEGREIVAVAPAGQLARGTAGLQVLEGRGRWLLPGFIDDHVHLREPGLEHKEGYATGTRAAAAGGITTLLEIQNNPPLMTTRQAVQDKLELVRPKSVVDIAVYASLVDEALPHVAELAEVVAGYKLFMGPSTGGLDIRGEERLAAMFGAVARTGHWLFVHAEDGDLIEQGLLQYGEAGAAAFHLARPASAEVRATETALRLARQEGTRLHVFHLSSGGAVEAIAAARAAGQVVTAGTCPHYLYFTNEDTARLGTLLKVNPSIKTADDRDRLLQGLREGTIDCLSSDHAPHTAEEKALPFRRAPSGIPSLDIFMPLCLTLAERGLLTLETVLERATAGPARVHGLERKGRIAVGCDADLVLVDPQERRRVRGAEHYSKARHTPWEGLELVGWPALTMVAGEIVFRR